jgi:uncharacterized protein
MDNASEIDSNAALDELYAPPAEMITKAISRRLHAHHRSYLAKATFFSLATSGANGIDVSPRGGPPGFVHVIDDATVAFADWPGNNRIESMRNIVQDDRVGMLFIFSGLEIFLRLNGRARISTEQQLLGAIGEGSRLPKSAIVVAIDELIFHCGKAINRSGLWKPEFRIEKGDLPNAGIILRDLAGLPDSEVAATNEHYDHGVKSDLY